MSSVTLKQCLCDMQMKNKFIFRLKLNPARFVYFNQRLFGGKLNLARFVYFNQSLFAAKSWLKSSFVAFFVLKN